MSEQRTVGSLTADDLLNEVAEAIEIHSMPGTNVHGCTGSPYAPCGWDNPVEVLDRYTANYTPEEITRNAELYREAWAAQRRHVAAEVLAVVRRAGGAS